MGSDDHAERATRLRRGARLGAAAARHAVDGVGGRGADMDDRAAIRAAGRLVAVLGDMRGAAMKLGQTLATVDLGLVPPHAQPEFAARLAELTDRAPAAAFEDVLPILEEDCPISAFADIDPEPFAAASIGQVHRGRTRDGREVVLKVQYPDIETLIRADLKNLALFLRLWRGRRAELLRAEEVLAEINATILCELDYPAECAAQESAARRYAGHPFIRVPAPLPQLSGRRVLVTEYCPGERFGTLASAPEAERNRAAEIVHRFYVGGIFRDGEFCGDPHPGNVLVCDDGRLAFLDYGLYKRLGRDDVAFQRDCFRAAAERRADDLLAMLRGVGAVTGRGPDPARLLEYFRAAGPWHLDDHILHIDAETVRRAAAAATRPPESEPPLVLPAGHTFSRRAEVLAFGLVARLDATADWHRICREWVYGDAPSTVLGREHERWAAAR